MNKIIIGIDPDFEKNGVCIIKENNVFVYRYTFSNLIYNFLNKIKEYQKTYSIDIIIEASWLLNKSYYKYNFLNPAIKMKIMKKIGLNQSVGLKIVECCKYLGLPIREELPIKDKKINNVQLTEMIKEKKLQSTFAYTNQDERDAIRITLHYAF